VKYLRLFWLFLLVFWLGLMPMARADLCRDRFGQKVCILQLQRSAKNYWEYRAKVSLDGKKQVRREIYNCRDRTLTRPDKYPIPFKVNSPGELVCQMFEQRKS
jgi:hypothetical protein